MAICTWGEEAYERHLHGEVITTMLAYVHENFDTLITKMYSVCPLVEGFNLHTRVTRRVIGRNMSRTMGCRCLCTPESAVVYKAMANLMIT